MATEVVMPRLSDTMDSGTIAKWLKQEGDAVKRGDIIAEIETDKANMELESYAAGVMAHITVAEGQSASVGAPIAVIAKDAAEAETLRDGDASATSNGRQTTPATEQPAQPPARAASEPEPSQAPPTAPQVQQTREGERIKASPLARRLAQERGIDLVNIQGTGPGGRVTQEDVQAFVKTASPQPSEQAVASAEPAPVSRAEASPSQQGRGVRAAQPVEMTRMQTTIARRMTEARFSAPEFVLTTEVDMTEARALLRNVKGIEGAPKIGPNDLLVKAAASALSQHPEVNSGWENNGIVHYGRVNIGVAVAIPGGLVVPVVQDADQKSLGQIALEAKELIEKARSNKLAPREYEGGTFSISNLGMYGIDQFTPIINPPEACILGVGALAPKPVVIEGDMVVRDRMRITLACDHRVINGAQGAEFLQTLQRLLEHPMLVLL